MELSAPYKPIRLLDPSLIHRIAAGEVVDRPASILKELVENSLDAQARHIRVTIVDGGLESIQVEDDGVGIPLEDLHRCVQRHATSKISNLEDLEAIRTLGFRGEALSAASSVSHLVIDTFTPVSGAWTLEVIGGSRQDVVPGTRKKGTKVSINQLFFNIPARRKFLKKPSFEAHDCVETLEFISLAYPEIHFEWYVVNASGEVKESQKLIPSTLPARFCEINRIKSEVLYLTHAKVEDGLKEVSIVAAHAPAASTQQKSVRLAVNGRALNDKRLPYALREAYSGLIEVGLFPWVFIKVEADPSLIDVNIHPQKKEIRWPQGFSLPSLVYTWLRPHFEVRNRAPEPELSVAQESFFTATTATLEGPREMPEASNPEPYISRGSVPLRVNSPREMLSPTRENINVSVATKESSLTPDKIQLKPDAQVPNFRFQDLRVVGEVGAAWLIGESPRGLILIDQHAAHERVEFERILQKPQLIRSRMLLVPEIIKIPMRLESAEAELRRGLETLHFEISELSARGTLELLAVPECDRKISWGKWLEKLFASIGDESSVTALLAELTNQLAASLACHGSVRRGQRLSDEQIRALLQQMDALQWGGLCPHGRPVWFELSHEKIEEIFHRS